MATIDEIYHTGRGMPKNQHREQSAYNVTTQTLTLNICPLRMWALHDLPRFHAIVLGLYMILCARVLHALVAEIDQQSQERAYITVRRRHAVQLKSTRPEQQYDIAIQKCCCLRPQLKRDNDLGETNDFQIDLPLNSLTMQSP